MTLENYCQNKWINLQNVSKNITEPCASNSECRVKKLIQNYEHLTVSAKNNDFQSGIKRRRTKSAQYLTNMCDSISLDGATVNRFLSLDLDSEQNVMKSDMKMPKSNFKIYVDELDKDRKTRQSISPSRTRKKDDVWKYFFGNDRKNNTNKQKNYNNNSLPNKKKPENYFKRSLSTTPSDKNILLPNRSDTGAIRKQLNLDDVTYRKRRKSYLLATQSDENPQKSGAKSYVSQTINKFEQTDRKTKQTRNKIEQLLQQYHDNKKFGSSNKIAREELSLKIDNVLLNKFNHLSRDSSPEVTSVASHNNLQQKVDSTSSNPEESTAILFKDQKLDQNCEIGTKYVVIVKDTNHDVSTMGEGQETSKINDFDGKSDGINIREKLTAELNRVLSNESVEDLCDDLEKVISDNLTPDVEVKDICVSIEPQEDNMIQNEPVYTNLVQEIDETLIEEEPKRKVSNLVNYFSDIISDISESRRTTLSRRSSISTKQDLDVPFQNYLAPSSIASNSSSNDETTNMSLLRKYQSIRITSIDQELEKKAQKSHETSPDIFSESFYASLKGVNQLSSSSSSCSTKSGRSLRRSSKSFSIEDNVYENWQIKRLSKAESSSVEQINTESNSSHKKQQPQISRLYGGKFSRRNSTASGNQDPNNNESKRITEQPKIDFQSDSDGDYDYTEAFNDLNPKFKQLTTSDWVQNTVERIESHNSGDEEDAQHIYERIRRSGSLGTLCTIYDDQKNPIIRITTNGEVDYAEIVYNQLDDKIEESERDLKKSIEEIKDNSRKACLINELITTERSYINQSLHRIVFDYMPEMDKEDVPKGILGRSRQIFANADMLYEEHKYKFLPHLEKHSNAEELADCFLNHETLFKLYPLYSKNKPKSDHVLRDYGYYFKRKQGELNDKLDLASYLLTPIQRLAKYCQFLKGIVKEYEKEENKKDNKALEKLKSTQEMLDRQMRMGNDLIALDSIVGYNGSIRDYGEVLLRDVFMVQPPSKRQPYEGMIFLFQKSLIVTCIIRQDFRETFAYRESFELTDMGYTDIDSEPLEFSVWFRKRGNNNYRFRTKNQEVKQKWVKEIFNLLWKQLEANKRKRKKELEESGVKDTRVPVVSRPHSVPNKGKGSGYSTTKTKRKNTLNSSADTIWYLNQNINK